MQKILTTIVTVVGWLLVGVLVFVFFIGFALTGLPLFVSITALLIFLGFKVFYSPALKRHGWWMSLTFVAALLGSCTLAENNAELNAKTFCSHFTVGGDFSEAVEAANAEGASVRKRVYEASGTKTLALGYDGSSAFSSHKCNIDGVDGKITRIQYWHYSF